MKKTLYLLILLIYSCVPQKKNQPNFIKIDIDNSEIIEPRTIIDSIQLISLETNKVSLIAKVKKLMIYKGDIFILDSRQQALFKFSSKGKFITKIHRIGKGPGEYIRISDFCIDKKRDQIILLTDGKNLSFYSNNGEFVKQINLKDLVCHYFTYLENDNLLLYSETSEYRFYYYDLKKKKVIQKDIRSHDFIFKTGFGHLYSPFSQKDDNSYYFTDIYSYDIFNIYANKIICKKLDFGKYGYNLEKLSLGMGQNAYKDQYKRLLLDGKYALNIFYFFETTNYVFLSYIFDKKTQTFILNKRTKSNYLFDQYQFPTVNYYKDDYLYAIIEPLSIEKYIPPSFGIENINVNLNDNPIVITYKFKKDV